MKAMYRKSLMSTLMVVFMMITVNSYAQGAPCDANKRNKQNCTNAEYCQKIPDLTDTQKEQIKKLRTKMTKEVLPLQNQIREKTAHLQTLSTMEKPDMKAIETQIDEIAKLRAQIAKLQARMRQEIRALLTEDQRLFFDTHKRKGPHQPRCANPKRGGNRRG